MPWKRFRADITADVDQDLLLRNEYLVTENRILRGQIRDPLRLTAGERKSPAEIGKRLGRKALGEIASIVTLDTSQVAARPRIRVLRHLYRHR